jgi:lipoprotein-anchoring transpeptidase ErfK/SrfK
MATTTNTLVIKAGANTWEPDATSTVAGSLVTSVSGVPCVNTTRVADWVNYIASRTDCTVKNMTAKLNKTKKRIDFSSRTGLRVDRAVTTARITTALNAGIASGSFGSVDANIWVTKPKGLKTKYILERLTISGTGAKHHGFGYLYNYDGKLQKSFRTAIGMPGYPTPTGTYRIGRKVKWPTWTNPGGGWGAGMPSFIGPGPSNPLGTRAIYVYDGKKDTGVRFHGTTNRNSIGTAASHGCLRMKREAVEALYPLVPVNTVVYIIK